MSTPFMDNVAEPNGIATYTFMDDHLNECSEH